MQDIYRYCPADYHPRIIKPDLDPRGITFELCSPTDVAALCCQLHQQIDDSGRQFDLVIACLRGGRATAVDLSARLHLPSSSIQAQRYHGINEAGAIQVTSEPPEDLTGKRVLLAEDVVDQGDSLQHLDLYFARRGVASLSVATLHQKPHTKRQAEFVGAHTTHWVVYPWETEEFISTNLIAWQQLNLSPATSFTILHRLGFSELDIHSVGAKIHSTS